MLGRAGLRARRGGGGGRGAPWRRALRCVALHDGSASSRQQALALADGLCAASISGVSRGGGGPEAGERFVTVLRAPFPAEGSVLAALPVWALASLSAARGEVVAGADCTEMLAACAETARAAAADDLDPVSVVIGCGRRTGAACVGAKRALLEKGANVFNVQVLDPRCGRLLTPLLFDKVVTPQHDRPKFLNAVATLGALSWVGGPEGPEAALAREREAFAAARGHCSFRGLEEADRAAGPRLVVLCGGDTSRVAMDVMLVEQEVVRAASRFGVPHERVFVLGSRRTPPPLLLKLEMLGMQVWTPPREWVSRDGPASASSRKASTGGLGCEVYNPYRACVALGDAFVVTGDSVSMISDACSTGKPVFVVHRGCDGNVLGSKLERFHSGLVNRGCVVSEPGPLSEAPGHDVPKLTDAQDAAALILHDIRARQSL